jgi:RIO-like serine/threonine protein kinase
LEEEEETKNVSTYLNALIEEINKLVAHGIVYADEQFDILISSIICDSPAKAFIKNVKQYSSYSGCDKCTKSGTSLSAIKVSTV